MGQSCTIGGIYASNNINKFKKNIGISSDTGWQWEQWQKQVNYSILISPAVWK